MSKSLVLVTILVLIQVFLAQAGGSPGFRFDVARSSAYLNAGNCYLFPGVTLTSFQGLGYQYYGLPYGWKQANNYLYIPNLFGQRGDWTFGVRASYSNSDTVNELFKVTIDGLQIKLAPITQTTSYNLVIGSNFRSQGVSDRDYNDFLTFVTQYTKNSVTATTVTSTSNTPFGGSSRTVASATSVNDIVQNLISRRSDNDERNLNKVVQITTNTPSSVIITTGPTTEQKKAALDRQYDANLALTNLNTLIKQLEANVQASKSAVATIQSQLANLRTSSSQCNDKIMEFNNGKLRFDTILDNYNDQLTQAKLKLTELTPALNALEDKRRQLITQRQSIERSKTPNAKALDQLEDNYGSCNDQVSSDKAAYAKVQASIETNNDRIAQIRSDVSDAPNQINLVTEQINVVDGQIADLQAKLEAAKNQRVKLVSERDNYNRIVQNANNEIANIQREVDRATAQLPALQAKIDRRILECNSIKKQIDDIRAKIASSQADYDQLVQQIAVQESLIAGKQNEITRLQADISALPSKIAAAKNDLKNAQDALQRQYYICNQFTSSITNAESDLRAANLKLDTESKFLADANSKLPAAQAEKRAADEAVEKLLAQSTKAVAVPATTTTTTTIVGGIAGAVSGSSAVIYGVGPTTIGNINDYLDRLYGANVRTLYGPLASAPASFSTMYPLSTTTINALYGASSAGVFLARDGSYLAGISAKDIGSPSLTSRVVGNFGCAATGSNLISGYGKITSVQPGYITIQTPTKVNYNLRIGGCSRLEANRPEFIASVLDPVFFRGVKGAKDEIQLYDLTCLSAAHP